MNIETGIIIRKEYINFSKTEKEILFFLLSKPYQRIKTTPYNIAKEIGRSESHVSKSIRRLKDLGILVRSEQGAWFISADKEEIARKIVESPFKKIRKSELGL